MDWIAASAAPPRNDGGGGCAGLLDLLDCFVGLRPIPRSTRDRHCVASCALRAGTAFAMTRCRHREIVGRGDPAGFKGFCQRRCM